MKVEVKYFAAVREAMGCASEMVETDSLTLADLRDQLVARGGAGGQALARGRTVRVALNQVMQDESVALHEGAEVAFFPPVTGG